MRRTPPPISRNKLQALALICFAPVLGACGLLNGLEDDGSLIDVFISHHATPRDGEFPEYGIGEYPRIFTNDQGWTVTLAEAYLTVVAAEVVACSGNAAGVDLYWGPCAEDFIATEDTDALGIGAVQVGAGTYCSLNVLYGPFDFESALAAEDPHELPENEQVDGSMIYVRGRADKEGEEPVQFEWSSGEQLVVSLDVSTLDGGKPIRIEHDENFPTQLTIGKSYDRYFEGIDFATYTDADLGAAIMSSLENDTRAHFGAGVAVQYAAP